VGCDRIEKLLCLLNGVDLHGLEGWQLDGRWRRLVAVAVLVLVLAASGGFTGPSPKGCRPLDTGRVPCNAFHDSSGSKGLRRGGVSPDECGGWLRGPVWPWVPEL
jgi:hypothetical protein